MTSRKDLIIVGGGPSGLAAAYEAEKAGKSYTLIEVKPELGGAVHSAQVGGFVMDGGPFAFPAADAAIPTLRDLGLTEALFPVDRGKLAPTVAFKAGTATLTNALAGMLRGTVIQRMAVTSVGMAADGGIDVCLENGLALSARGVVLAAPARYTERMLRTLSPEIAVALENYHYDALTQVALGYLPGNTPTAQPIATPDMFFARLYSTGHPARVPEGGMLIQAALRVPPGRLSDAQLVAQLTERMGWPTPDEALVHSWPHAAPLTATAPPETLARAHEMLPPNVALAGNCYTVGSVLARLETARALTRRVIASLPISS